MSPATMNTNEAQDNNAAWWIAFIRALYSAHQRVATGGGPVIVDGTVFRTPEQVAEYCKDLSHVALVRSAWYAPDCSEALKEPVEYQIIIPPIAPALRFVGQLGSHLTPETVCVEKYEPYGGWLPWKNHDATPDELLWFVRHFWYGGA